MYYLSKRFTFEAAHQLPHHDGKCARRHGHSWVLVVLVSGETLVPADPPQAKSGMLVDFGTLKARVQPLVDGFLDHYDLNESLAMENPTSENIARWVFERLHGGWPEGVELAAVTIEETCTSKCTYSDASLSKAEALMSRADALLTILEGDLVVAPGAA